MGVVTPRVSQPKGLAGDSQQGVMHLPEDRETVATPTRADPVYGPEAIEARCAPARDSENGTWVWRPRLTPRRHVTHVAPRLGHAND
jgi:hypothetical protein